MTVFNETDLLYESYRGQESLRRTPGDELLWGVWERVSGVLDVSKLIRRPELLSEKAR